MADFYNTVIIQETEPSEAITGWIWILPSISTAYIYINGGWVPFAGSGGITSASAGTFWRAVTVSATEPTAPDVGDMWVVNNQAFIYLDNWSPFAGG